MNTSSALIKPRTHAPNLPVAPVWHSVILIAVILAASLASARQQGLIGIHLSGFDPKLVRYLTTLAFEWLMVLFVCGERAGAERHCAN